MESLIEKIEKWGDDKGITDPVNVDKQFMKFIEEVFEFKPKANIRRVPHV